MVGKVSDQRFIDLGYISKLFVSYFNLFYQLTGVDTSLVFNIPKIYILVK